MKHFLVIVVGPTGVGKTQVSIALAEHYHTEVISADSRQIYKELRIGTAVPTREELQRVPHHFIGSVSITDYYNASMYENEVLERLEVLFKQYNPVMMTGGTGMYIDAVCRGIDDLPAIDPEVRSKLIKQYEKEGIESLRMQLKVVDPEHYQKVDLMNPKRVLKALEVSMMTGKPYSSFLKGKPKPRNFDTLKIGLTQNREELYRAIDRRVDSMILNGLEEEARTYYAFRQTNALNTVGYKELFDYFDGNISLEKAIELIKRNSRRYAKRQLSWFARDKEIRWFQPGEIKEIMAHIDQKMNV